MSDDYVTKIGLRDGTEYDIHAEYDSDGNVISETYVNKSAGYVKDASVNQSGDTLTITKGDGSTVTFQGGGGGVSTSYRYYRLNITKFKRTDGSVTQYKPFATIGEFKLYNQLGQILSHIDPGVTYQCSSETTGAYDYSVHSAFDNDTTTRWMSSDEGESSVRYLQVSFTGSRDITYFSITPHNQSRLFDRPVSFSLIGSNDNTNWDTLYVAQDLEDGWAQGVERFFIIPTQSLNIDDHTLKIENGILKVNTTNNAEQDNTLPITSAGVNTIVGNIEVLLSQL